MAGFPARCRTLGDQGQAPPLVAPAFPAHCGSPSVEGSSLHWLHVSQTCGHPAQNTMGHGSLKTLVLRFGHCRCVDQPVGCCGQQGRYHSLISSWCWPNKGSTGNPPAGGSVWKERVFARSNNHLGDDACRSSEDRAKFPTFFFVERTTGCLKCQLFRPKVHIFYIDT